MINAHSDQRITRVGRKWPEVCRLTGVVQVGLGNSPSVLTDYCKEYERKHGSHDITEFGTRPVDRLIKNQVTAAKIVPPR